MITNQFNLVNELIKTPLGVFELTISIIIRLCVLVIFAAIVINFMEAKKQKEVKNRKKSIVETGTMILFFVGFYFLIKMGVGTINQGNIELRIILAIFGTTIIVMATIINIVGRLNLGQNWANQVTIYTNQTLVRKGVYRYMRHPLYASLIWMFFASSIMYLNWAAFLANLLVFVPFMTYRANQEEVFLSRQFSDYKKYQQEVGMFFPKFGGEK